MKYIGIDYGTKRVGIATSDDGGAMAFPKIVVPTEQAVLIVRMLIDQERAAGSEIGGVVIGESTNRDGTENVVAEKARVFGEEIRAQTNVKMFWEWEGYSSAMARSERAPRKDGMGHPRGDVARKQSTERDVVDARAAAIILQSFLDKQKKSH
jgi:putative Holliday junction resolvase